MFQSSVGTIDDTLELCMFLSVGPHLCRKSARWSWSTSSRTGIDSNLRCMSRRSCKAAIRTAAAGRGTPAGWLLRLGVDANYTNLSLGAISTLSLSLSPLGRHFNYSLLFSLSLSSVFIRPLSIRPTSHPKNFSPHLLATEAVPYQSLAEENLRVVVVSFSQSASGPAIDFPPATTMRIRTQGKWQTKRKEKRELIELGRALSIATDAKSLLTTTASMIRDSSGWSFYIWPHFSVVVH